MAIDKMNNEFTNMLKKEVVAMKQEALAIKKELLNKYEEQKASYILNFEKNKSAFFVEVKGVVADSIHKLLKEPPGSSNPLKDGLLDICQVIIKGIPKQDIKDMLYLKDDGAKIYENMAILDSKIESLGDLMKQLHDKSSSSSSSSSSAVERQANLLAKQPERPEHPERSEPLSLLSSVRASSQQPIWVSKEIPIISSPAVTSNVMQHKPSPLPLQRQSREDEVSERLYDRGVLTRPIQNTIVNNNGNCKFMGNCHNKDCWRQHEEGPFKTCFCKDPNCLKGHSYLNLTICIHDKCKNKLTSCMFKHE